MIMRHFLSSTQSNPVISGNNDIPDKQLNLTDFAISASDFRVLDTKKRTHL